MNRKSLRLWSKLLVIGVVASSADFGVLVTLAAAGTPLWLGSTVSYLLGITVTYGLMKIFVRRKSVASSTVFELPLFYAAGVIGAAVNDFILLAAQPVVGLEIAKLVSLAIVFFLNNWIRIRIFESSTRRNQNRITNRCKLGRPGTADPTAAQSPEGPFLARTAPASMGTAAILRTRRSERTD